MVSSIHFHSLDALLLCLTTSVRNNPQLLFKEQLVNSSLRCRAVINFMTIIKSLEVFFICGHIACLNTFDSCQSQTFLGLSFASRLEESTSYHTHNIICCEYDKAFHFLIVVSMKLSYLSTRDLLTTVQKRNWSPLNQGSKLQWILGGVTIIHLSTNPFHTERILTSFWCLAGVQYFVKSTVLPKSCKQLGKLLS